MHASNRKIDLWTSLLFVNTPLLILTLYFRIALLLYHITASILCTYHSAHNVV